MERFFIISLLGCINFLTGRTDDVKNAPSSVFGEIRSSNETFVDKTLWLKEFYELNTSSKHIYLAAPFRYGKTTNLKMMEEFFSITNNEKQARELFEDTLIHSKEKNFFDAHFRKYPVIYFNFQPLLSTTNKLTFRENMCKIFTNVRNNTDPKLFDRAMEEKIVKLKDFNKDEFEFGNVMIDYTKALHTHYSQKIIVLMDEMDAAARASLKRVISEQNAVKMEFKHILKQWLEGNEYIEKSFSVGSVYSDDLLHINPYPDCIEKEVYNLKESFVKYFGITETEVEHLLEKSSLADYLPRFKLYYDGYSIAHSPKKIFNTISPTKFVKNRKFAPYWAASIEPLKNDFLGLFSRPLIGSLIEKAIFWDMMKLPEFPHLKPAIGKDMFHAVRGNATVDPEVVAAAGDIFFNYLYESGYIGMITVDGFLATNQDAAFALGTTLARDSNYYQNARNISSAAKMKLVKAVKNLALSEEPMVELAAAIHGLYHPACSLVTEERVSFVGPIFTILAYEDPEAFEEVISPLRVAFQPTKPDVVLLRKDSVAFVFALRRNESAREAAEAALSSEYEYVFEKDFKGVKIKSTMFVGINLDVHCRVSIGFGEEGIQVKEIKEVSSPIDETG
nr:PREDICTED: uncharacterized protein LOC109044528 [Bemisia tabaci]